MSQWEQEGVPQIGWECVDVIDLGAPEEICDMCKKQEIRYVHYMKHPNHPFELGVGCICAGHMENDYNNPEERERSLRNNAARKGRWLGRIWKTSAKGNDYIKTDKMIITIFQTTDGNWKASIKNIITKATKFARREYPNANEAKLAAFDAMIFLKNNRGWGI